MFQLQVGAALGHAQQAPALRQQVLGVRHVFQLLGAVLQQVLRIDALELVLEIARGPLQITNQRRPSRSSPIVVVAHHPREVRTFRLDRQHPPLQFRNIGQRGVERASGLRRKLRRRLRKGRVWGVHRGLVAPTGATDLLGVGLADRRGLLESLRVCINSQRTQIYPH